MNIFQNCPRNKFAFIKWNGTFNDCKHNRIITAPEIQDGETIPHLS